jgi:multiple sugar transport system permease protein
MWTWDNFLASLIYLNKPQIYTVTVALRMFIDPSSTSDFGATLAMSVVSLLPIFFIFIFLPEISCRRA